MAGKRKCREEDEASVGINSSLENRISQPESKKARKRRRKAEREALERNNLQSGNWLDKSSLYPPASRAIPPVAPLQARLDAERQHSKFLEERFRLENEADLIFHEYGPPSSNFDSNWVSSMTIAGEFPHKKVETSMAPKGPPGSAPKTSSTFPSSPSPKVLPPIHIHPNLAVSTEAPPPSRSLSQPPQPQPIGMKPEQDPSSRHGIFHITDATKEAGSGLKHQDPYIPNPARTLVMEQLPKTHRTVEFVDNWCRSACGIPAFHLFVDPPSAKALIEFATADLARKAWASPRLGQNLLRLGMKSHQMKGIPREDQIKVWWYRVNGVGAGAGVGEIEEGEIEEDLVKELSLSPRKESKKERKARLSKERETKKMATMKENQQQQKQKARLVENMSTLDPIISHPASSIISTAQLQAKSGQLLLTPTPAVVPLPTAPFNPIIDSRNSPLYFLSQSTLQAQSPTNFYYPISCSTSAVGASLAPGARGGHDDSASIASSGGRSSPDHRLSRQSIAVVSPSKSGVAVTTVGQTDDLANDSGVNMDVYNDLPRGQLVATSAPPYICKKPTSLTTSQSQMCSPLSSAKGNALPPKLAWPNVVAREARAITHHPDASPFIDSSNPSPQTGSTASLSFPSLTSIPHAPNSAQRDSVSSVHSESLPSVPVPVANSSNALLSSAMTSAVHSEDPKPSDSIQSELGISNLEPVAGNADASTPACSHPASSSVPKVPISVVPSLSNSGSAGQAMEENLRQLVFASKRARALGVQQPSTLTDTTSSIHDIPGNVVPTKDGPKSVQTQENEKPFHKNNVKTPVFALSSATIPPASSSDLLKQSTTDTFSFEDLAITFITQTIENIKANPSDQPQSSISTSSAPPTSSEGIIPEKLDAFASLTKSELSAKQRRLEKHLQESRYLMERISTAKTKRERDLLLKIMSEKIRCVSSAK